VNGRILTESIIQKVVSVLIQNCCIYRARLKKQGNRDTAYYFKVRQMQNTDSVQADGRAHPMLTAMIQSSAPGTYGAIPPNYTNRLFTLGVPNRDHFEWSLIASF